MKNGDNIFIAEYTVENEDEIQVWGNTPIPLGAALANDFSANRKKRFVSIYGVVKSI